MKQQPAKNTQRKCRRLLRIPQAVEYLDNVVSAATIRGWIHKEQIDVVRLHGIVCIPIEALDALIERGRVAANKRF